MCNEINLVTRDSWVSSKTAKVDKVYEAFREYHPSSSL